MKLLESMLRRIIREELKKYRPSVDEVVKNAVQDFFEDINVTDLTIVDKESVKDESGSDILERYQSVEFYDEVEVFRVIFDIASEERMSVKDISLEDLTHINFDEKRVVYVYNLRLDALKYLSEEELNDLSASLIYLTQRKNYLSLLVKRISSNLMREGYTFNHKREIIDVVITFLKSLKNYIR